MTPSKTNEAAKERTSIKGVTLSPEQLADKIALEYMDAMREVRNLVEGLPPAEEIRPGLEAAFEGRVQTLVAMGHLREAMDEAGQAGVDSHLTRILMSDVEHELGSLDWLSEANRHYMATDPDVASKITAYNVITQYANFELLRRQSFSEAKRLCLVPATSA